MPFMWAYFCMGACKQDDVVVVIEMVPYLWMLVLPTLSYETHHMCC